MGFKSTKISFCPEKKLFKNLSWIMVVFSLREALRNASIKSASTQFWLIYRTHFLWFSINLKLTTSLLAIENWNQFDQKSKTILIGNLSQFDPVYGCEEMHSDSSLKVLQFFWKITHQRWVYQMSHTVCLIL